MSQRWCFCLHHINKYELIESVVVRTTNNGVVSFSYLFMLLLSHLFLNTIYIVFLGLYFNKRKKNICFAWRHDLAELCFSSFDMIMNPINFLLIAHSSNSHLTCALNDADEFRRM